MFSQGFADELVKLAGYDAPLFGPTSMPKAPAWEPAPMSDEAAPSVSKRHASHRSIAPKIPAIPPPIRPNKTPEQIQSQVAGQKTVMPDSSLREAFEQSRPLGSAAAPPQSTAKKELQPSPYAMERPGQLSQGRAKEVKSSNFVGGDIGGIGGGALGLKPLSQLAGDVKELWSRPSSTPTPGRFSSNEELQKNIKGTQYTPDPSKHEPRISKALKEWKGGTPLQRQRAYGLDPTDLALQGSTALPNPPSGLIEKALKEPKKTIFGEEWAGPPSKHRHGVKRTFAGVTPMNKAWQHYGE
jgi:hypothetical protein